MTEVPKVTIDPLASDLMSRAAELARRDGSDHVGVADVLRAMLHRKPTPALIQHLLKAASIAEDAGGDHISDLHVFRAQLSNAWSQPAQLVEELSGIEAIVERIDMLLAFDAQEGSSG